MRFLLFVSLIMSGVALGVVVDQANSRGLITKAAADCYSWCDKNNQTGFSNKMCKSQCAAIIIESQCLRFPN